MQPNDLHGREGSIWKVGISGHALQCPCKDRWDAHSEFKPLTDYLVSIESQFPHGLFQATEHRSSKFPAEIPHETPAAVHADNDSVTVAVEVPVFLTQEDISYYRSRGFDVDFESDVITGHIDQIRNGHIHILDYKPYAKEGDARPRAAHDLRARRRSQKRPATEILQMRLVRREGHFEFYPLQGVYKRRDRR